MSRQPTYWDTELDALVAVGAGGQSLVIGDKYAFRVFVPSGNLDGTSYGLVPRPPVDAGTTKFLRQDGVWAAPSGVGGGTDHDLLNNLGWLVADHTASGTTYPALAGWSAGTTPALYHLDGTSLEWSGTDARRAALTGDVTASAGANATTIAANAVSNGKFRQSVANSVVGRASASTGNVGDIQATTTWSFLGFNGTSLSFLIPDHVNVANLAWSASGHTGTANRYAGFDGSGVASYYTASQILDDILTTKGDLLSHDGSSPVRVGVGTNDYSIVADSTAAPGWRWYQRRLTTVVTTTSSYVAIALPTDCTYVTIRCVGSGAPGGSGTSGTTAAARRGGGSGGGGAEHEITYLRSQLPDTIYAFVGPSASGADGNLSWVAITDTGISTDPTVAPAASYLLAGGGGRASAGTAAGAAGSGGTATTITASSPWCRACVSQRAIAGGDGQASSTTSTTTNRTPWSILVGSGITQGGAAGGSNSTGAVAGAAGAGWDAIGPFSSIAGGTAGTGANAGAGVAGVYGGGAATPTTTSSDPGELSWAYGGSGGGSAVTGNGGAGGAGAPGCGGGGGGAATGTAGAGGAGGQGYVVVTCF